jgi:hypothetical protein
MPNLLDKINRLLSPELYTVLVIILVGFGSFGLGRLSRTAPAREGVQIVIPESIAAEVQSAAALYARSGAANSAGVEQEQPTRVSGTLVASRNGGKYHFPWCSGAQRIAEKNKVWFASASEARAAGYEAAKNCKGLE